MDVPRCGCGEPAVQRTVKKAGSNKGRQFFGCSTMSCKFFEWSDGTKSYPAMRSPGRQLEVARGRYTSRSPDRHDPEASPWASRATAKSATAVSFVVPVDSSSHFGVQHAFRSDIVSLWKKISSEDRSYDPDAHTWTFPWDYYRVLLRKVSQLPNVAIVRLPEALVPAAMGGGVDSPGGTAPAVAIEGQQAATASSTATGGAAAAPADQTAGAAVAVEASSAATASGAQDRDGFPDPSSSNSSSNSSGGGGGGGGGTGIEAANEQAPLNQQAVHAAIDRLPTSIAARLYPHQRQGLEYIVARGGRTLLADSMGLGKTFLAVAAAAVYRHDWPLLVVCPSSLSEMWRRDLVKWIPGLQAADTAGKGRQGGATGKGKGRQGAATGKGKGRQGAASGKGKGRQGAASGKERRQKRGKAGRLRKAQRRQGRRGSTSSSSESDTGSYSTDSNSSEDEEEEEEEEEEGTVVVPKSAAAGKRDVANVLKKGHGAIVTSYELATSLVTAGAIRRGQFGMVICDESHKLKSVAAKRTKAICPLLADAKRALCLSGTPALSRPVELYAQVDAVLAGRFMSYTDYTRRYCAARKGGFGLIVTGSSNLEELHGVLKRRCMLRRKKEDILKDLPPIQRHIHRCALADSTRDKVRKALANRDRMRTEARAPGLSPHERQTLDRRARGFTASAFQATGEGKIRAVIQLMLRLLQEPDPRHESSAGASASGGAEVALGGAGGVAEDFLSSASAATGSAPVQHPGRLKPSNVAFSAKRKRDGPWRAPLVGSSVIELSDSSDEDSDMDIAVRPVPKGRAIGKGKKREPPSAQAAPSGLISPIRSAIGAHGREYALSDSEASDGPEGRQESRDASTMNSNDSGSDFGDRSVPRAASASGGRRRSSREFRGGLNGSPMRGARFARNRRHRVMHETSTAPGLLQKAASSSKNERRSGVETDDGTYHLPPAATATETGVLAPPTAFDPRVRPSAPNSFMAPSQSQRADRQLDRSTFNGSDFLPEPSDAATTGVESELLLYSDSDADTTQPSLVRAPRARLARKRPRPRPRRPSINSAENEDGDASRVVSGRLAADSPAVDGRSEASRTQAQPRAARSTGAAASNFGGGPSTEEDESGFSTDDDGNESSASASDDSDDSLFAEPPTKRRKTAVRNPQPVTSTGEAVSPHRLRKRNGHPLHESLSRRSGDSSGQAEDFADTAPGNASQVSSSSEGTDRSSHSGSIAAAQNPRRKLVVFAHHKSVVSAIGSALFDHGIQYVQIVGDTQTRRRQGLVDRFQEDPACRVALVATSVAGVGITLTESSCALFAELAWTPGDLQQAEARVHRIGQRASRVDVHYVLADDSMDQSMWDLVAKKLNVVASALDSAEKAPRPVAKQPTMLDRLFRGAAPPQRSVSTAVMQTNGREDTVKELGEGVAEAEEAFQAFVASQQIEGVGGEGHATGMEDAGSSAGQHGAAAAVGPAEDGLDPQAAAEVAAAVEDASSFFLSQSLEEQAAAALAEANLLDTTAGRARAFASSTSLKALSGAEQCSTGAEASGVRQRSKLQQVTMTQLAKRARSRLPASPGSLMQSPARAPGGSVQLSQQSSTGSLSPDLRERIRRNREAAFARRHAQKARN